MSVTSEFSKSLNRSLGVATIAAVLGAIGMNYWFNIFPPQGVKIADLANSTYADVLFIPASYAFSIWGLIYCGLIAFSISQLRIRRQDYTFVFDIRPWLILACILQTSWVYTFLQRSLLLSSLIMVGLLLTIMRCYQLARVGQWRLPGRDRWLLQYPWSIYLAWISVATIVNISITLKESGWNGFGLPESGWTVALMLVAALHAVAVFRQRRDWPYVTVVIWALLALVLRYAAIGIIAVSGILMVMGLIGMLGIWWFYGPFRQSF